jgi:hypothetical protein
VRAADAALGQLLEGVRQALPHEPLIIVAGDHGEMLDEVLDERGWAYDHGEFLDAATLCVPLVVAGPGVTPGRSAAVASIRDVYATLVAAADLSSGEPADRRDLRGPIEAGRIVAVERKRIAKELRLVPDHAAAAFDASGGVLVGGDGTPVLEAAPAGSQELIATAAHHAQAVAGRPGAPSRYPDLEEALRSLGYVQ